MADADGVHRVPLTIPGTGAVVMVPDEQVDARLALGWKKVRTSRRADTGSVPVQQAGGSGGRSADASAATNR